MVMVQVKCFSFCTVVTSCDVSRGIGGCMMVELVAASLDHGAGSGSSSCIVAAVIVVDDGDSPS